MDVALTDSPIRNAEGDVVAIARVARDITGHKAAEGASARLASIVESSGDAIISLDAGGVIQTWNNGAEQLYGYLAAEAIGQHAPTLLSREPDERAQLLGDNATHVLRDIEVTDYSKDGTRVEVSGTSSPICDSDGRTIGISLILRDVSERKRLEAERRRIELDLRRAQKLEAIGGLAAGIAHEINTPMQYIGDSAHFLHDAVHNITRLIDEYQAVIIATNGARPPELKEQISIAEEAADLEYLRERVPAAFSRLLDGVQRVASIVRAMKTFGHASDGDDKAPADLNEAVRTTLMVARNEYKYVAEIETILGDLPPVISDIGAINQVLLNLIINAAHAIEDGRDDTEPRQDHDHNQNGRCERDHLDSRHRLRHPRRTTRSGVRALLYNQGSGPRHRPRTRTLPRNH